MHATFFLLFVGLPSCAALEPGPAPCTSLAKQVSPSIRRRRSLLQFPTSHPTVGKNSNADVAASLIWYGICFFCCGLPVIVGVCMLAISPIIIGILSIVGCAAPISSEDVHFMS